MKVSVKGAARDALRSDAQERKKVQDGKPMIGAMTDDSFVNFAQKLGMGADNALTTSTYGINPITRNRTQLEWMHRGSWLAGMAIDIVAEDMTRAGINYVSEMEPHDSEKIDHCISTLGCWPQITDCIKWGRLYGGAICVVLIDGQDLRTPLRPETVGPGRFKGLLTLDRWQVDPTNDDLVTDYGPWLGLPKYYRVSANAPALRGQAIHYSRVMVRHTGIQVPYQQRLTENLWGVSVIERIFDRMVAFDSASMGAAQLVYKSYLRTLKVKDLREIVSSTGSNALKGLVSYVEMMRRYQGIEGITMIDAEDDFDIQGSQAFSGLDQVISQMGQQLAGAMQIPLVRLFGSSPGGLNSSGDSDHRTYYDGIKQQQTNTLGFGVPLIYRLAAQSEEINLPENFRTEFASLYQLDDVQKAATAKSITDTVMAAHDGGLVSDQVALKELRQSSRVTGVFTNITEDLIDAAEEEPLPPPTEMSGELPGSGAPGEEGQGNEKTGSQGTKEPVGSQPRKRIAV